MKNHRTDEEGDLFTIDPLRLDEEYVNFSTKYARAAKAAANATDRFERAKAELKVVSAELDHAIRSDPEQFEVSKVTDKVVEMTILRRPRFIKAQERYLDAKHAMEIAETLVKTLDHHRFCIDGVWKLVSASYLNTDMKPPRDMPQEKRQEILRKERDSLFRPVKARRDE